MSIERGLINQTRPIMLDARVQAFLAGEASKGCRAELTSMPVALEPTFRPISTPRDLLAEDDDREWTQEAPSLETDLLWLRIWVSPEQECDWARCEAFVRQLHGLSRRVGLEIAGNAADISLGLLCHRDDVPLISGAFAGTFEACALRPGGHPLAQVSATDWATAAFFDYLPTPPYSHLLTRPNELPLSPYATVIRALAQIPPSEFGLYQVVFQPVEPSHNWHSNVQVLLDLEYAVKLMTGFPLAMRFAQQAPSGDLRQMAMDAEAKAHNDRPFYAAALRLAVIGGEHAPEYLAAMAAFTGLIQHGGRPLERLDTRAYRAILSEQALRGMFLCGRTHRAGFLVNSAELTSLVHIPAAQLIEQHKAPVRLLETLTVTNALTDGSYIGDCSYADIRQKIRIPASERFHHTHIIGGTGTGKTSLLEDVILDDIDRGDGVAVLDAQGPLTDRLLGLIPQRHVERVIYLDFGDPDLVPIFNPLCVGNNQLRGRLADDIVGAFKGFVQGWGDRLEHLLRFAILGVLHLPRASLLDVSNALRTKSDESTRLRDEVLKVVDGELLKRFWREDLKGYSPSDLTPPQHKLSKLLSDGSLALMLSQTDSLFHLGAVMDEGKILLLNLSSIGTEVRGIVGCLWLSLLRVAALTRERRNAAQLRPFHIHVDEAQVFITHAMEQIITETRKYRVSITLAHHYLRQFSQSQVDALGSVGTTIIRRVDTKDAAYLLKDLQDRVSARDITSLTRTDAIARIGNEIVRFKTRTPRTEPERNFRREIIEQSQRQYYRPAAVVKKAIRNRVDRWAQVFSPLTPTSGDAGSDPRAVPELTYDEF